MHNGSVVMVGGGGMKKAREHRRGYYKSVTTLTPNFTPNVSAAVLSEYQQWVSSALIMNVKVSVEDALSQ